MVVAQLTVRSGAVGEEQVVGQLVGGDLQAPGEEVDGGAELPLLVRLVALPLEVLVVHLCHNDTVWREGGKDFGAGHQWRLWWN